MSGRAVDALNGILTAYPWVAELAGVLPLSALLDFIDVPLKLHVFELIGGVPLWSWPVTPAGGRLLLSTRPADAGAACCLDRVGASTGLVALDGRFGDKYFVASPETLRLARDSTGVAWVNNSHDNLHGKDLRVQNLEVIHVRRLTGPGSDPDLGSSDTRRLANPGSVEENSSVLSQQDSGQSRPRPLATLDSLLRKLLPEPWSVHSAGFLITSAAGWLLLGGFLAVTIYLRLYLATAFFAVIPATGLVAFVLFGSRPRRLLVQSPSSHKRLVVVAEHMNATEWLAFYGESTLVNSLLNRPLEPSGLALPSQGVITASRILLRALILGQWAVAIGAAVTKDWNSFFICFWVVFCIVTHAYVLTPARQARDWLRSAAKLRLDRYRVQLSSRRALLNALITLNPDTFDEAKEPVGQAERRNQPRGESPGTERPLERSKLSKQGVRWVDHILEPSGDRTLWEAATTDALNKVFHLQRDIPVPDALSRTEGGLSETWQSNYKDERDRDKYWKRFIVEGVNAALKIRRQANLTCRTIGFANGPLSNDEDVGPTGPLGHDAAQELNLGV